MAKAAGSSASSIPGWVTTTQACPRAIRCRHCRRAVSRFEPLDRPTERLVRVIPFRPHVMTTYDENGGYPHPVTFAAMRFRLRRTEAAGDYRRYPDAGHPWNVSKLYYNHGFPPAGSNCCRTGSPNGRTGPFEKWLQHWDTELDVFRIPGHHPDPVLGLLPAARRRPALSATRSTRTGTSSPAHQWQRGCGHREFEAGPFARAGVPCRDRSVRRGATVTSLTLLTISVLADDTPATPDQFQQGQSRRVAGDRPAPDRHVPPW